MSRQRQQFCGQESRESLTVERELRLATRKEKIRSKNYYIDHTAIADAIERSSSFNLIHLETSIKVDVFIPRDEIYHHTAMDRRHRDTLFDENMTTEFYFCSPEDIIINKLQCYVSGGGVSERQWLDVSGVIKVQAESLDTTYLLRWSKDLGLHELLVRAFEEAGVPLQS